MKSNEGNRLTYSQPPVAEVAISVQFESATPVQQSHIGHFWGQCLKGEFPATATEIPIEEIRDNFSSREVMVPVDVDFGVMHSASVRQQFFSTDQSWLIQLQPNRFVLNWRKRDSDYPRFPAILNKFLDFFSRWQDFLLREYDSKTTLKAWELIYVNSIVRGNAWTDSSGWRRLFPGLWGNASYSPEDATLLGMTGRWIWSLPQNSSHLLVEARPAKQRRNNIAEDLLMLNLTSRGGISSQEDNLERRFTEANLAIVAAFDAIVSSDAKKAWCRNE